MGGLDPHGRRADHGARRRPRPAAAPSPGPRPGRRHGRARRRRRRRPRAGPGRRAPSGAACGSSSTCGSRSPPAAGPPTGSSRASRCGWSWAPATWPTGSVTLVDRIGGDKKPVPLAGIAEAVGDLLAASQAAMLAEARVRRDERTVEVTSLEEAREASQTGWARVPWAEVGPRGGEAIWPPPRSPCAAWCVLTARCPPRRTSPTWWPSPAARTDLWPSATGSGPWPAPADLLAAGRGPEGRPGVHALYFGPQSVRFLDERRGPCPRLSFRRPPRPVPEGVPPHRPQVRDEEVTTMSTPERVRTLVEPAGGRPRSRPLRPRVRRRRAAGGREPARRRRHGRHHRRSPRPSRGPSTSTTPSPPASRSRCPARVSSVRCGPRPISRGPSAPPSRSRRCRAATALAASRGTLQAVDADGITLALDEPAGETRSVAFDQIERARTVFAWGPAPKPGKAPKPRPVKRPAASAPSSPPNEEKVPAS